MLDGVLSASTIYVESSSVVAHKVAGDVVARRPLQGDAVLVVVRADVRCQRVVARRTQIDAALVL